MSNFSRGCGSVISRLIGVIARAERPQWLVLLIQRIFIALYKLNMGECRVPPQGYFPSLHALFIRDLLPGVRKFESPPIIPVDGALRDIQNSLGALVQVKGISYTISELTAGRVATGVVINMYLSPKDYHQVHTPVDGLLEEIAFVPGALWPVNDWALNNVPKLFSTNERAIFTINNQRFGKIYVVMVGALNVGNILTQWGEASPNGATEECLFPKVQLSHGDKLGAFALGSSVLVVLPTTHFSVGHVVTGPVRLGECMEDKGVICCGSST